MPLVYSCSFFSLSEHGQTSLLYWKLSLSLKYVSGSCHAAWLRKVKQYLKLQQQEGTAHSFCKCLSGGYLLQIPCWDETGEISTLAQLCGVTRCVWPNGWLKRAATELCCCEILLSLWEVNKSWRDKLVQAESGAASILSSRRNVGAWGFLLWGLEVVGESHSVCKVL